jgi:hypothetical protein
VKVMKSETVIDLGPEEGSPERAAWVKRYGPTGAARIVVFSTSEAIERDPRRYCRVPPPGVNVREQA